MRLVLALELLYTLRASVSRYSVSMRAKSVNVYHGWSDEIVRFDSVLFKKKD